MLNRTARVAAAHAEEIARRRVMGAEPPQAIKMEDGKMGHTTGIPVSPNGVFQHHNAIRSATRGDKKYSLLDDGSQAAYHAVDFGVRSLPAGLTEVYRSTVELHRSLVENLVDAESELTKAKATLATATEEAAKEAAQKAVQTRQAVVDKLRAEMPSDIIRGVPSYIKSLVRMIDPAERKRLKEELIAAYDGTQLDRIFANICDLIAFTDLPRDKTGHTVQALDVYDTLEQQITERKTLHHGLYSGLRPVADRWDDSKDKETWFNLFCTRAQSLIREAGFLIVTTTAGEPSIPTGNSKKGASINAANVDGYDYDNDGDDGYTAPYSGTPYTPPPSSSPAPSAPHSQLLGSSVNLVHTTPSTPPTTNPIYQSALPAPQQPAPGHKPVPGCCDWHAPVPGKDYGNRPPIGRPYDYARTQTVTAIRTSQGYPRDARPRSGGPDSGRETEATTDSLAMVPIAPVQTVPITPTQPSASDIAHFVRDVNATTATQPMLTTYLEPKGPGVCWARVRNAIDAEGDSEEARAHRFPKPHDNMYPVFTQASNYRTAVFTEDAHMPRRRDLSFANETEMEFFVIARDISGHAKNGRFPIPPALDVNPGIPCADGTHAHHSHPHWHLLAARPLINPKGHSEHKRLNAAVTRIIADTATEDDVTTLRTWIAIARETTTIAAINTNISNTNEQLRRPYRGAEGEQLLHLVEMAAMAITNTGAPPPRTRQAAANHVTSVLRKELEAFDVDTTVQAIVNALCARRVFTFTDGAMDTTDAPPAPTTTLTLPGAAVVESLLNRVKTSFTDAQNRSPTFMRPNRRTAAVNYVESTLRTYLRGYDVESTILLLVYILEREGELRFASGPDATSAKAADAYARFVAANAPTDPVAGPSSVATAEGLAPEDKTPIVPPTTPTPPAPAVLRPKASEDRADNDPINRNRKLREMLMDIAEDSITLIARRHQAAGRYAHEGGDRVFASRTVEKIMVSVGGQQILLFLSPVDMPAPCHTCSIGPDGSPVIVNHRLRASVISIAHRYYEYIDSTTGNTVTMTNVELQEHCRLCTTPPYMEFVRNCPVPSPTSRQRTPYPSTLRPDDAPADITLDALYGVTMEMKTLFLRIIGLLMDITPQGTTSLTGNDDWPRVADIFLNVDVSPFTVRASTLRPGVRDASTGPIGTRPIILAPGVVNTSGQDTSRLARTTVNASLPVCLSAPAFYHAHALMHPVDEPNTRLGPTPTDLPPYPVPETTVAAAGEVSRKLASIYVAAVLHDWPARQRDKIKPHLTLRTNDVDMEYLRLAAENARLRDPTQFSARYLEVHNVLTDILRRRTPGTPSPTTPPDKHAQLLADEQLARELQARLDAEAAKGEDPVQAAAQAPYLQAAIGGIARGRTMDARRRTAAAQAPPRQSARHGGTVRGRGRALPIHTSRPQTPGHPHYHDDDMTCPTAPVTPPTDARSPRPAERPTPAPEVTASSTDTPDAQPVAPATTTPDAQPVAPVTTTPVAPTPALETPVSSTAARDASPIAPAMATSLTTPHSVPSPTAVAAVSTAPSPAPELLARPTPRQPRPRL
eukprot:tig00000444_g793.t1